MAPARRGNRTLFTTSLPLDLKMDLEHFCKEETHMQQTRVIEAAIRAYMRKIRKEMRQDDETTEE